MTEPSAHEKVRESYNAVAASYGASFRDELSDKPLDRALLTALLEETGLVPHIVDIGCGPGHVTAWFTSSGAHGVGIDLSDAMVSLARLQYPNSEFRQGDVLALPANDQEFDAAIAFYSLIHLQESELTDALAEIHRVLKINAMFLAAFHVGHHIVHRDEWFDQAVDLDFRFLEISEIKNALAATGFVVTSELTRAPYPGESETTRGYVLAQRLS